MGKYQKEHWIIGSFDHNGEKYKVEGIMVAARAEYAYTYACCYIKRILGIKYFFNFNVHRNRVMDSSEYSMKRFLANGFRIWKKVGIMYEMIHDPTGIYAPNLEEQHKESIELDSNANVVINNDDVDYMDIIFNASMIGNE